MDYKNKYKNALRWIESIYPTLQHEQQMEAEGVFPELAESEDERIRKELIKETKGSEMRLFETVSNDEFVAWLEKLSEQKLTDNVEPKFKVGDWLQYRSAEPFLVEEITEQGYINGNSCLPFEWGNEINLWSIQDAKDGDVLACNEEILLFKSYSVQGRISLYCWYNGQTKNFHSKEVDNTSLTTRNKIFPATKEQRDTLFAKMKEAGYEWNADKKELKKIEQKSAWSEDDEIGLDDALWCCKQAASIAKDENDMGNAWYAENWLKSIKDRIGSGLICTVKDDEKAEMIVYCSTHPLCCERCGEYIWEAKDGADTAFKADMKMAKWKDEDAQAERQALIDKSCEWLRNNSYMLDTWDEDKYYVVFEFPSKDEMIEYFRKAMKGGEE